MSKKNRNRQGFDMDENITLADSDADITDDFEISDDVLSEQEPSVIAAPEPPAIKSETIEEQPKTIELTKEETMPATEIKHQVVTPVEQPKSDKAIVTPKRTASTRFNELSKKYIALARNGVKTEEQKKQAVAILTDIVYLVTTSHDKSVFDTCLSFFLTNRAIMLSEQTVISSVTHYADQTKINRIVQFYVVFTSLVESKLLRKRYTININHVRDVFNNKQLAEWLTDKR